MKQYFYSGLLFLVLSSSVSFSWAGVPDTIVIKKISDEIFTSGECYKNLEYLCKKIGSRLSGSEGADKAVKWTQDLMKSYGLDTVYLQEVMVPHWVRGAKELAKVIDKTGKEKEVNIIALGSSVATPVQGLTAEVVEVKDFEGLKKMGKENIQGKIVFFNYPFDVTKVSPFEMYRMAAKYRVAGAIEAARLGAVASITRSMTNYITDKVNTGNMRYNDSITKIPACAISTLDAEWLSSLLKSDGKAKMFIKTNCQTLPDVKSYNVIGELRGAEHPEEIVLVGGHLDSWDLAEGAHDDGTGCMQSIEVLRTIKKMGIKPKRTLRAVLFMNEENGTKGADWYAKQAEAKKEKHILAIESDAGGFTPRGFSMTMDDAKKQKIYKWKDYFFPYGVYDFTKKGSGTDVAHLEKQGCALMGLSPDSQRYFIIHHTVMDTFEQVNKRELELGSIAMTMMVYLVSEYGL